MADNFILNVQYMNEKSCSAQMDVSHLKNDHLSSENLADFDVVKLTTEEFRTAFFGLSPTSRKTQKQDAIFLNGLYAAKIGLKNSSKVSAELLKNVSVCVQAFLEPVTVDDWEIIEIHSQEIERSLLDQIRVLWPGQVFPLWVTGSVCIFVRTVAIEPEAQCGILMPLTELVIEPKINRVFPEEENAQKKDTEFSQAEKKKKHNQSGPESHVSSKAVVPTQSSPSVVRIGIDGPSEPRRSVFQRLLRLAVVRRLVQILGYIFNILWHRIIPAILGPFSLFKAVPDAIASKSDSSKLSEKALASIGDFPEKYNLVLRVEPMHAFSAIGGCVSPMERFDEAGFALLSTSNSKVCRCSRQSGRCVCECDITDSDFGFFLVALKKLPSKKVEVENATTPISAQPEKKAVIRLCVQPMSKFEMFFRNGSKNDEALNEEISRSLKLSSVLRLQQEIGVCSRVCIRKLKNVPKPANGNIKKIIFRVLDDDIPKNISPDDLRVCFERWLKEVANDSNPLPFVCGSVFSLPVKRFFSVQQNQANMETDSECLKILICAEKILNLEDSVIFEYFLITGQDLSSIEIEFLLSPTPGRKSLYEIDPKIPHESIEGLIPAQKSMLLSCVKHAEAVFRTKPIFNHLGGQRNQFHPGFILLTGPTGTGRTHLCQALLRKLAISEELQTYVKWISCSSLKGKKPEAIKKLLQNMVNELEWRQPAALLLDDIDNLLPSNRSVDGESSQKAIYALQLAVIFKEVLSKLCRSQNLSHGTSKVFVIATAISEQEIHPVLLPAQGCYIFSKVVAMQLPENNERQQLLRAIVLSNLALDARCLPKIDLATVSSQTEGFAAKDFVQVTKRAMMFSKRRKQGKIQFSLNAGDFVNAISGFVPISLQDANLHKPKKFSWTDVGGLRDVRKQLMEKLVWPMKYAHLYQSAGMQLRSGILLYGPPGCGKTLLAGVVANECNLNFISVKGPELLSKYIGASEAAVRELFNRASAAAPCILFFDEFDSVAQKRGHDSTGVTDRVVNQILTHLDGVEPLSGVYVLAATSRPDLIDPAILRPGRLDTHLCCDMPDFDERCDILSCLLKKLSLADEINVRTIAARCQNFTGADLRALVYDAQLDALHSYAHSPKQLSENSGSTFTQSRSITPLSIGMELDDCYNSNGMKSIVNDIKEELNETPSSGVQISVADITNTAANLVESIRSHQKNANLSTEQYKICYGVSSTESSFTISPRSGFSAENEKNSSRIIYFPSLYSKASLNSALPEYVQEIVSNVTSCTKAEEEIPDLADNTKSDIINVASYNFETVLASASPSVSASERQRYFEICRNFSGKDKKENGPSSEQSTWEIRTHQRATLA